MKFEKTIKIRNKIFGDADIRALWNSFLEVKEESVNLSQSWTNPKGSLK